MKRRGYHDLTAPFFWLKQENNLYKTNIKNNIILSMIIRNFF